MKVSSEVRAPAGEQDLVEMDSPRFEFTEHRVEPGQQITVTVPPDQARSFVVIAGEVTVEATGGPATAGTATYGYLAGWHADPGLTLLIGNSGAGPALILRAGATTVTGSADAGATGRASISPLSDYTVSKPWGHEVWYTENRPEAGYAVKQIYMTKGNQSSLQSHRFKAETNYVIEGSARVLNGTFAPDDLNATIDVCALPARTHGPRSGWTSPPGMLHRVIAESDYLSVEVSTPELDDVIRWQDDTARSNGRIAGEHPDGGTP